MKAWLLKLFSENPEVSAMRVMSITALAVGSMIAFISLFKSCDLNNSTTMVAIFVGAAFTGKVAHKYAEKNNQPTGAKK